MTRVVPESWDGGQVLVRCNADPRADDRITVIATQQDVSEAMVRLTVAEAADLVAVLNAAIAELAGDGPAPTAIEIPASGDLVARINELDTRLRRLERPVRSSACESVVSS